MNNLEEFVQIALSAYDKAYDGFAAVNVVERCRNAFELELRRSLMQRESQLQLKSAHTYTINPPNLMGTWTTGGIQTRAMDIPPTVTNKEILHG